MPRGGVESGSGHAAASSSAKGASMRFNPLKKVPLLQKVFFASPQLFIDNVSLTELGLEGRDAPRLSTERAEAEEEPREERRAEATSTRVYDIPELNPGFPDSEWQRISRTRAAIVWALYEEMVAVKAAHASASVREVAKRVETVAPVLPASAFLTAAAIRMQLTSLLHFAPTHPGLLASTCEGLLSLLVPNMPVLGLVKLEPWQLKVVEEISETLEKLEASAPVQGDTEVDEAKSLVLSLALQRGSLSSVLQTLSGTLRSRRNLSPKAWSIVDSFASFPTFSSFSLEAIVRGMEGESGRGLVIRNLEDHSKEDWSVLSMTSENAAEAGIVVALRDRLLRVKAGQYGDGAVLASSPAAVFTVDEASFQTAWISPQNVFLSQFSNKLYVARRRRGSSCIKFIEYDAETLVSCRRAATTKILLHKDTGASEAEALSVLSGACSIFRNGRLVCDGTKPSGEEDFSDRHQLGSEEDDDKGGATIVYVGASNLTRRLLQGSALRVVTRWYFEVEMETISEILCIGCAGPTSSHNSVADSLRFGGAGDAQSWGIDVASGEKWTNGIRSTWGAKCKAGDVIGCLVEFDFGRRCATMSFSLNGSFEFPMGTAFHDVPVADLDSVPRQQGALAWHLTSGLRPIVAVSSPSRVRFNAGGCVSTPHTARIAGSRFRFSPPQNALPLCQHFPDDDDEVAEGAAIPLSLAAELPPLACNGGVVYHAWLERSGESTTLVVDAHDFNVGQTAHPRQFRTTLPKAFDLRDFEDWRMLSNGSEVFIIHDEKNESSGLIDRFTATMALTAEGGFKHQTHQVKFGDVIRAASFDPSANQVWLAHSNIKWNLTKCDNAGFVSAGVVPRPPHDTASVLELSRYVCESLARICSPFLMDCCQSVEMTSPCAICTYFAKAQHEHSSAGHFVDPAKTESNLLAIHDLLRILLLRKEDGVDQSGGRNAAIRALLRIAHVILHAYALPSIVTCDPSAESSSRSTFLALKEVLLTLLSEDEELSLSSQRVLGIGADVFWPSIHDKTEFMQEQLNKIESSSAYVLSIVTQRLHHQLFAYPFHVQRSTLDENLLPLILDKLFAPLRRGASKLGEALGALVIGIVTSGLQEFTKKGSTFVGPADPLPEASVALSQPTVKTNHHSEEESKDDDHNSSRPSNSGMPQPMQRQSSQGLQDVFGLIAEILHRASATVAQQYNSKLIVGNDRVLPAVCAQLDALLGSGKHSASVLRAMLRVDSGLAKLMNLLQSLLGQSPDSPMPHAPSPMPTSFPVKGFKMKRGDRNILSWSSFSCIESHFSARVGRSPSPPVIVVPALPNRASYQKWVLETPAEFHGNCSYHIRFDPASDASATLQFVVNNQTNDLSSIVSSEQGGFPKSSLRFDRVDRLEILYSIASSSTAKFGFRIFIKRFGMLNRSTIISKPITSQFDLMCSLATRVIFCTLGGRGVPFSPIEGTYVRWIQNSLFSGGLQKVSPEGAAASNILDAIPEHELTPRAQGLSSVDSPTSQLATSRGTSSTTSFFPENPGILGRRARRGSTTRSSTTGSIHGGSRYSLIALEESEQASAMLKDLLYYGKTGSTLLTDLSTHPSPTHATYLLFGLRNMAVNRVARDQGSLTHGAAAAMFAAYLKIASGSQANLEALRFAKAVMAQRNNNNNEMIAAPPRVRALWATSQAIRSWCDDLVASGSVKRHLEACEKFDSGTFATTGDFEDQSDEEYRALGRLIAGRCEFLVCSLQRPSMTANTSRRQAPTSSLVRRADAVKSRWHRLKWHFCPLTSRWLLNADAKRVSRMVARVISSRQIESEDEDEEEVEEFNVQPMSLGDAVEMAASMPSSAFSSRRRRMSIEHAGELTDPPPRRRRLSVQDPLNPSALMMQNLASSVLGARSLRRPFASSSDVLMSNHVPAASTTRSPFPTLARRASLSWVATSDLLTPSSPRSAFEQHRAQTTPVGRRSSLGSETTFFNASTTAPQPQRAALGRAGGGLRRASLEGFMFIDALDASRSDYEQALNVSLVNFVQHPSNLESTRLVSALSMRNRRAAARVVGLEFAYTVLSSLSNRFGDVRARKLYSILTWSIQAAMKRVKDLVRKPSFDANNESEALESEAELDFLETHFMTDLTGCSVHLVNDVKRSFLMVYKELAHNVLRASLGVRQQLPRQIGRATSMIRSSLAALTYDYVERDHPLLSRSRVSLAISAALGFPDPNVKKMARLALELMVNRCIVESECLQVGDLFQQEILDTLMTISEKYLIGDNKAIVDSVAPLPSSYQGPSSILAAQFPRERVATVYPHAAVRIGVPTEVAAGAQGFVVAFRVSRAQICRLHRGPLLTFNVQVCPGMVCRVEIGVCPGPQMAVRLTLPNAPSRWIISRWILSGTTEKLSVALRLSTSDVSLFVAQEFSDHLAHDRFDVNTLFGPTFSPKWSCPDRVLLKTSSSPSSASHTTCVSHLGLFLVSGGAISTPTFDASAFISWFGLRALSKDEAATQRRGDMMRSIVLSASSRNHGQSGTRKMRKCIHRPSGWLGNEFDDEGSDVSQHEDDERSDFMFVLTLVHRVLNSPSSIGRARFSSPFFVKLLVDFVMLSRATNNLATRAIRSEAVKVLSSTLSNLSTPSRDWIQPLLESIGSKFSIFSLNEAKHGNTADDLIDLIWRLTRDVNPWVEVVVEWVHEALEQLERFFVSSSDSDLELTEPTSLILTRATAALCILGGRLEMPRAGDLWTSLVPSAVEGEWDNRREVTRITESPEEKEDMDDIALRTLNFARFTICGVNDGVERSPTELSTFTWRRRHCNDDENPPSFARFSIRAPGRFSLALQRLGSARSNTSSETSNQAKVIVERVGGRDSHGESDGVLSEFICEDRGETIEVWFDSFGLPENGYEEDSREEIRIQVQSGPFVEQETWKLVFRRVLGDEATVWTRPAGGINQPHGHAATSLSNFLATHALHQRASQSAALSSIGAIWMKLHEKFDVSSGELIRLYELMVRASRDPSIGATKRVFAKEAHPRLLKCIERYASTTFARESGEQLPDLARVVLKHLSLQSKRSLNLASVKTSMVLPRPQVERSITLDSSRRIVTFGPNTALSLATTPQEHFLRYVYSESWISPKLSGELCTWQFELLHNHPTETSATALVKPETLVCFGVVAVDHLVPEVNEELELSNFMLLNGSSGAPLLKSITSSSPNLCVRVGDVVKCRLNTLTGELAMAVNSKPFVLVLNGLHGKFCSPCVAINRESTNEVVVAVSNLRRSAVEEEDDQLQDPTSLLSLESKVRSDLMCFRREDLESWRVSERNRAVSSSSPSLESSSDEDEEAPRAAAERTAASFLFSSRDETLEDAHEFPANSDSSLVSDSADDESSRLLSRLTAVYNIVELRAPMSAAVETSERAATPALRAPTPRYLRRVGLADARVDARSADLISRVEEGLARLSDVSAHRALDALLANWPNDPDAAAVPSKSSADLPQLVASAHRVHVRTSTSLEPPGAEESSGKKLMDISGSPEQDRAMFAIARNRVQRLVQYAGQVIAEHGLELGGVRERGSVASGSAAKGVRVVLDEWSESVAREEAEPEAALGV